MTHTRTSPRRPVIASVLVGLLAMGACGGNDGGGSGDPGSGGDDRATRATFTTADGTVRTGSIDVADTSEERSRGLMGVASLAQDEGMVFLYEEPSTSGFWMKDTLIPLQVAFWDEEGTVTEIIEMTPCEADPCPSYQPKVPYLAALEMNAGWFTGRGIRPGDRVELLLDG